MYINDKYIIFNYSELLVLRIFLTFEYLQQFANINIMIIIVRIDSSNQINFVFMVIRQLQ